MRASLMLVGLVFGCSSPGTTEAPSDSGLETSVDAPPEASTEATCFERFDGTSAAPKSGDAKIDLAKSFTQPNGRMYDGVLNGDALYVHVDFDGPAPHSYGGKALDAEPTPQPHAIAKVSASGDVAWVHAIVSDVPNTALAPFGDGVLVAQSVSSGTVALAGKSAAVKGPTIALFVLDGAGIAQSVHTYPSTSMAYVRRVGVDGSGRVYLGLRGGADFGIGPPSCDLTIAQLDASLSTRWARCVASSGAVGEADGFAVDGGGGLTISGFAGGTYDLGLGTETVDGSVGASYLARLDENGTTQWTRQYRGAYASELAPLADGSVLSRGDVPAMGEVVVASVKKKPCGTSHHNVVAHVGKDGTLAWARLLGDSTADHLVSDGEGGFAFSGQSGTGEIANGLASPGHPYMARVDAMGNVQWVQDLLPVEASFAGVVVRPAAFDGAGNLYAVSTISFAIKVGSATIDPKGSADLVVRIAK